MVGLGVDLADMPAYVAHNCLGTAVLLAALHERRIRGRIVLAGSMVVYGEGRYRCERHGIVAPAPRPVERLARGKFEPPCPRLRRGAAARAGARDGAGRPAQRLRGDEAPPGASVLGVCPRDGLGAIALRYHNVYGPRMPRDTPYAGVASIFRSALEAGRAPRVFEDGGQLRDFVSVHDVAAANLLALDAPAGSGRGLQRRAPAHRARSATLAAGLARVIGGPAPTITGEFRLGDVRHVFASTDKARATLGFESRVGLREGLSEFAAAPLRNSPRKRRGGRAGHPARSSRFAASGARTS